MSTATVNQNETAQDATTNGSTASDNVSVVREDVVIGTIEVDSKDKDGNPVKLKKPVRFTAESVGSESFKKDYPSFVEAFKVTTQISKPRNVQGIKDVMGDNEEEAGRLFYNGASQKVNNRMNKFLLDQDEDGNFTYTDALTGGKDDSGTWTGSVVDLDVAVRSESQRKTLTEDEKMIKALSGLPDAVALVTYNAWRTATGLDAVQAFPRS